MSVFAITAPAFSQAQALTEIASITPSPDAPCSGTVMSVFFQRNYNYATGTFKWSRTNGNPLPANWNTYPNGFASCSPFMITDNGEYLLTFDDGAGYIETDSVNLSVGVSPIPTIGQLSQCFGVVLLAGDMATPPKGTTATYAWMDYNGNYTIPGNTFIYSGNGGMGTSQDVQITYSTGCKNSVFSNQIFPAEMAITLTRSKWKISPGQTSTLTASANWPVIQQNVKWFQNGVLYAQGVSQITVSTPATYRVQMRTDMASGNCVKSTQLKVLPMGPSSSDTDTSSEENEKMEIVQSNEHLLDLQIGQNPVQTQLQLSNYNDLIEIVDINGRVVVTQNFTGSDERPPVYIDVTGLNNGIYLVRSGDQTQKMVVSH